jgi:hypothetical protein
MFSTFLIYHPCPRHQHHTQHVHPTTATVPTLTKRLQTPTSQETHTMPSATHTKARDGTLLALNAGWGFTLVVQCFHSWQYILAG